MRKATRTAASVDPKRHSAVSGCRARGLAGIWVTKRSSQVSNYWNPRGSFFFLFSISRLVMITIKQTYDRKRMNAPNREHDLTFII